MRDPELDRLGVEHAAAYLTATGMTEVARDFETPYGRLRLIVDDSGCIVFVDVTVRRFGTSARGRAASATDIRRMAIGWLSNTATPPEPAQELRFDRVEVTLTAGGEPIAVVHQPRSL